MDAPRESSQRQGAACQRLTTASATPVLWALRLTQASSPPESLLSKPPKRFAVARSFMPALRAVTDEDPLPSAAGDLLAAPAAAPSGTPPPPMRCARRQASEGDTASQCREWLVGGTQLQLPLPGFCWPRRGSAGKRTWAAAAAGPLPSRSSRGSVLSRLRSCDRRHSLPAILSRLFCDLAFCTSAACALFAFSSASARARTRCQSSGGKLARHSSTEDMPSSLTSATGSCSSAATAAHTQA